MFKKEKKSVIVLFIIRVCLWIVALVSTIYWMWFSAELHRRGIFTPEEYSPILRPVLYTCLAISIVAICISFALHAWSVRIKKNSKSTF